LSRSFIGRVCETEEYYAFIVAPQIILLRDEAAYGCEEECDCGEEKDLYPAGSGLSGGWEHGGILAGGRKDGSRWRECPHLRIEIWGTRIVGNGLNLGHPATRGMGWGLFVGGFSMVRGPVGFDFDRGCMAGGVVVETAPAIVFGAFDQAACYRVSVDVLDLFYEFSCGEGVEVVVAGLPELFASSFEEF
jgi:hypothetical protein